MASADCLLMTRQYDHIRKSAIISREIRNLISHFLTYKFSNRRKVLALYRMGFSGLLTDEEEGGHKGPPP